MIEYELPLYELFTRLRQANVPLGVGEYALLLHALQRGFGGESKESLAQLCRMLWIKSDEDERLFKRHFAEVMANIPEGNETTSASQSSSDDSSRAHSYLQLASIAHERREFEQAEQYLQQALQIFNDLKDDSGQAATYQQLGRIAQEQQQLAQAEPLFQRALAIREKVLGPEHADTARALDNLGSLYRDHGQYEKAEPLFQRALAIREKVLGPEHLDTAQALDNLGLLYRIQLQDDKAEPLYQRALAIREKMLGPKYAHTMHLQGAAELEAFITVKGDNEAADDAVRRLVVEAQVLALGAPAQGASGTAHLLHCTVPVTGTKIAMLPVFTRMEHVVAAVQMNPAWQSLQVLQMAGSVVLGDLEEEEWLGINPWSGHEFKLPATPSTNLPPAH